MRRSSSAATTSAARLARSRSVRKANGAMPSARWQPAHVSRTIGATSFAKLGAAVVAPGALPLETSASNAETPVTPTASVSRAIRPRALIRTKRTRLARVVSAPELAQRSAELADRRAHGEGLPQRGEEVLVRLGNPTYLRDGGFDGSCVPRGAQRLTARPLGALDLRVEPMELDALRLVRREAIDADDHALSRLDPLLPAERRVLDL